MLEFKPEKELTTLDKYKKLYGFYEGNLNYVHRGGDLTKHIGSSLALIDYSRDETGRWDYSLKEVKVEDITDYDPMTTTSIIKYKIIGEEEVKEARIIPEGFSFESPEETGKSLRFLPLSMHFKVQEEKAFYDRLLAKFDNAKTLSIEALENLSNSKEQSELLGRNYNIAAVIKTDEETPEILYFRIDKLKLKHNKQDNYAITLTNEDKDKTYTFLIDSKAEYYEFSYGKEKIGDLKILDLQKL